MSEMLWWYGHDEERFYGPCSTRESAIEEGRSNYDDDPFCIMEASREAIRLSDYFDAQDWVTHVDENQLADMGDPEGDSLLCDLDINGLQEAVRAAIDQWQKDRGLVINPCAFTNHGPVEWINDEDAKNV